MIAMITAMMIPMTSPPPTAMPNAMVPEDDRDQRDRDPEDDRVDDVGDDTHRRVGVGDTRRGPGGDLRCREALGLGRGACQLLGGGVRPCRRRRRRRRCGFRGRGRGRPSRGIRHRSPLPRRRERAASARRIRRRSTLRKPRGHPSGPRARPRKRGRRARACAHLPLNPISSEMKWNREISSVSIPALAVNTSSLTVGRNRLATFRIRVIIPWLAAGI